MFTFLISNNNFHNFHNKFYIVIRGRKRYMHHITSPLDIAPHALESDPLVPGQSFKERHIVTILFL